MADFRIVTAVPSAHPATLYQMDYDSSPDGMRRAPSRAPGANLPCEMAINFDRVGRIINIVDSGVNDMGAVNRLYLSNGKTLDVAEDCMLDMRRVTQARITVNRVMHTGGSAFVASCSSCDWSSVSRYHASDAEGDGDAHKRERH
jgi:hypothetical protein